MKNLLILVLSTIAMSSFIQTKPEIQIKIQNVKQSKGPLRIAFFRKGSNFPKDEALSYAKEVKPTKLGDLQLSWGDIPFGEYAIAIYQDINNNGVLDKNVFGYPSEPFGFSKNFKPRFSAPDFDDCKITFSGSNSSFQIKLID